MASATWPEQAERLQIALGPPGALPQEWPQARNALLLDHRAHLLVRSSIRPRAGAGRGPVLGQPIAPRPVPVGDGIECRETVELPVAAHSGRAGVIATGLVDASVDGELDVLHLRQKAGAVVDAYERLDAADLRILEVRGDEVRRGRRDAPVGIHDDDDDALAVDTGEALPDAVICGVERLSLAFPGIGQVAPENVEVRRGESRENLRRRIVGAIVDHDHVPVRQFEREEAFHAVADRDLLVEGGDEEDPRPGIVCIG